MAEHAHTTPARPSRRNLFVAPAILALAGAGALAAPAVSEPDAELLTLVRRWHTFKNEIHLAPDDDDAIHSRLGEEQWLVAKAVQQLVPLTAEGRAAKATVALALFEDMNSGCELDCLETFVMATLRDLAGRIP